MNTPFTKKSFRFAFGPPSLTPARPTSSEDVQWGRTIFRAPRLHASTQLEVPIPTPPAPVPVTRD